MNFLQKIFSQPKTEIKPDPPVPSDDVGLNNNGHNKTGGLTNLAPGIHIGKLSHVGQVRQQNEDSFCAIDSLIQHNYGREPFGLFIVADGMGGHQKGEVASSLAARVTASSILQEIYLPYLTNSQNANNRPLNEVLTAAVQHANYAVQEEVPDGGTTLTAALVMGNNAYIAHVGDTRAYLFKQAELKQITQDHSLARRLQETGQASADELMSVQNVLYKAIGQGSTLEVDTYVQHLPYGTSLLICSDGLWGPVADEDIQQVMSTASAPQEACQELVTLANKNGGPDNITAVIVSVGAENQADA
jgi:serine/threonine protein phosphatase PrpC